MIAGGKRLGQATLAALALCLAGAGAARAQAGRGGAADVERRGRLHGARPPRGFYQMVARHPGAFEFAHGWARARAVGRNRQALRARGAFDLLNAGSAATVVTGTLRYPTLMPFFSNTGTADSSLMDSAAVQNRFWGTVAAPPYSVTTYYKEISSNRLTVTGSVIGRGIRVSQPDTFYAGPPEFGQPCQGLCDFSRVPNLIVELLQHADSLVDFSAFADPSTGVVPAIVILDPQVGGECYLVYPPSVSSIWAHRFSLSGWGVGPYTTKDSINGHAVVVDDYIIEGGQGQGPPGSAQGQECTPGYLAPIGTVTHETGHLFGLPDLYDTSGLTEGIGRWDLMSSGNEKTPDRPAHMSAWSLSFLGWITEVSVATTQTIAASPIETGDTAYVIQAGATTDNEYFLVENRQAIGADSMMYGPGLMVYYADPVLMTQRLPNNSVNAFTPHALSVVEADGNASLYCLFGTACWNRGDAGDPFPGSTGNTLFTFGTNPSATKNSGAAAPVTLDSIVQLSGGSVRFRVQLGFRVLAGTVGTGTVTASRPLDPAAGAVFAEGDTLTLTAVPGAAQGFLGWTGDTTTGSASLKLQLSRPFRVTANFAATDDVINRLLDGSGPLSSAALQLLDQLGNLNGRFDLGDFVAWLDRNPGAVSPALVARLLRGIPR